MEKRGQERDMGIPNFMGYNPSQLNQESPVKLPLAPIVSTPPDRRGNATVSTRRGSAIFSPIQTLDHHRPLPPPPLLPPRAQKDSNPAPDPDLDPVTSPSGVTGGASNSKSSPPPPLQQGQESGASTVIRYRECLKNHAAKMGGHVVDGCGEFMPSGQEGTPEFLRCAACDCHRSFHRKEVQGRTNNHRIPVLQSQSPPTMPPQHKYSHTPPVMVAFGRNSGGAAADSSSEDLNINDSSAGGHAMVQPSFSGSKKRFRTKFSQEQKDKMHELAAKLGWRIQKQDEQEVLKFCNEVGVKREVFKVWLHNNKQAMKKRQI
ncbi:zinc-finger homeodomain protein 6-like [Olea europaea var. sylvestris]|uniref:Zinc-finger homeodomain 6-like n=1 Tax=Olea europaea subsp. europaea TaxID=158383 RepID=A0A8S0S4Y1_OLEEU|nr:zinc-finger homeodomain protein 6-like [Olea europaea var. sylvestris]XP_022884891.1 zinc-finger homeodomain protein 6-like [Olea europaea var. sylvestris]CAA2987367.1 zinc-finger homeodomain 6-like [Olea europaea subsp. europaea]